MIRRKTEPPRGVLKTTAREPQRFRYERYHPSDDLAQYVEHYWLVEWDLTGKEPEKVETLPHPSVHMIFEHGGKSRIGGPSTAKFSRLLEGRGGVLAAKFTPAGFFPFACVPVSKFADTTVELRDIFSAAGDELNRAVFAESDELVRIGVIEDFLRARSPRPDENVELISQIVYAVAKDRAIVNVEDLVDRYGINKRTLQRSFAKYVGVSPKWIIQRYRLHEAAEQLVSARAPTQTELAMNLGYSDQAHFVRDFKAIVGVSPAAYAKMGSP